MLKQFIQKNKQITSYEKIMIKSRIEEGFPVYLNIYHLTKANKFIQFLGIGFFHTTLEVNQIEYSFGATSIESSGIFYNKIGEGSKHLKLKEKKYLGNTLYNDILIEELLQLEVPFWLGKSYDPFLKNCNHFTRFLAKKLLNTNYVVNYPCYVNRISEYGTFLNAFYSPLRKLYCNIVYQPEIDNSNIIKPKTASISNISKEKERKNIYSENSNSVRLKDIYINCDEIKSCTSKDLENTFLMYQNEFLKGNKNSFFDRIIKQNPFLSIFDIDSKKSSLLKKLSKADKFLFKEDKINEALKIYESLIGEIDNDNNCYTPECENYLGNKLKYYSFNKKERNKFYVNLLLKIKILHCMNFIYYKKDLITNQEVILNEIISLNSNDYYAIYHIAYVKFIQYKFPETSLILQSAIGNIPSKEYKQHFLNFLQLIEKIEF